MIENMNACCRGGPHSGLTVGAALMAVLLAPAGWADTAARFQRALALNRFPASRHVQTDSRGFYWMPTAVEDDYFDGTSPIERVKRHFAAARRAGAAYFRCGFTWNAIEREPGKYNWTFWDNVVQIAQQNHIPLIPYVAYPPKWAVAGEAEFWKQPPRDPRLYSDFMYTIAARYRGRIAAWEIWNEPDNHDYWTGTADQFAPLVMLAAKRIREADPHAVLVLGGLSYGASPFFERLINGYHIDRYVDVVALHAYPETWSNERAETVFQEWIPAVWGALSRDQSGVDLWVNEMGYADYRYRPSQASVYGVRVFYRDEHTPQYQAAMLFKFEVMALASGHVSLTGWYRIDDFPTTEKRLGPDLVNYHLGLFDTNGRQKPAFQALRFFNRLFSRPTRRVPVRVGGLDPSRSVIDVFERADGKILMIGWLRSSLPSEVSDLSGNLEDPRFERVSVDVPCAGPRLEGYFDATGRRVSSRAKLFNQSLEDVELRDGSVLIAEFRCRRGGARAPLQ